MKRLSNKNIYLLIFLYFLVFAPFKSINAESVRNTNFKNYNANEIKKLSTPTYLLGPGDILNIKMYKFKKFDSTVMILPDGSINLPRLKSIYLNNKTIDEAKFLIEENYRKIIKNPTIYIDLIQARPIKIKVVGQVQRPGIYTIKIDQTNTTQYC